MINKVLLGGWRAWLSVLEVCVIEVNGFVSVSNLHMDTCKQIRYFADTPPHPPDPARNTPRTYTVTSHYPVYVLLALCIEALQLVLKNSTCLVVCL